MAGNRYSHGDGRASRRDRSTGDLGGLLDGPCGAVVGLGPGVALVRYIETFFYQVKATDLAMLVFPSLTLLVAALLVAVAPVIHAVRIAPGSILSAE